MSWGVFFSLLLRYGPTIVQLVAEIVELFHVEQAQLLAAGRSREHVESVDAAQQAALDEAHHAYKASRGDRRQLEQLRDRSRAACGFECRPMGHQRN